MTAPKRGSKYYGLYETLRNRSDDTVRLTFAEVEASMAAPLPDSAKKGRAFWSNRSKGALQASAWLQAGYQVTAVDLRERQVTFTRLVRRYAARREGGEVVWDAQLLRALRQHLQVSQTELAEILGVRQQTVSEWETGIYAPTRARSRHLSMVAERAGFEFAAEGGSRSD